MSIGETLAEARQRAGLSVSEVSERTRVRETIIRGIEDNDYAACGGDFYARGHIRAIAQAVGEDPLPLIDEFDSTFRSATEFTAAEAFQPVMPMRTRERRRVRWTAALAVIVLGVLGFASYKFVAGVGRDRHPAAATTLPAGPIPARRGRHRERRDQRPGGNPVCYSLGYPLALAHPGGGPGAHPRQRGRVRPGRNSRRRQPLDRYQSDQR